MSDTWGTGVYAGAEDPSAGVGTDYGIFYGWEEGPDDDES